MLVGDKITYTAANEAYCLVSAYIREEKIAANYDKEDLKVFINFMAEILRHPENFIGIDRVKKESKPVEE